MTPDYVQRRIEHAGATMRCLRIKHPSTLLAQGRAEIVREIGDYPDEKGVVNRYPSPSPRDVALMDEALSWVLLVPNKPRRRLVGLRSQFCPMNEECVISWRQCGRILHIDHKSAKSWHEQAMIYLATALAGTEIVRPVGCNVLPEHINFEVFPAIP
jgi:hypothetical protein